MKKRLFPIVAVLVFALVFGACGQAAQEAEAQAGGVAAVSTALYAEVVDVVSNQLSLKVLNGEFDAEQMAQRMAEMQNRIASMREGGAMPEGGMIAQRADGADSESRPADRPGGLIRMDENGEFARERPTDANGEPVTMAPGQPITNQNGEPVTNADGEPMTVPAMRERYTGEEKDVIIPVGTPIKSYSIKMPEAELKVKDAELADIKNGATINILYNDDGESIKEVQIVEMGSRGMGMPGGGPNMYFQGAGTGGFPPELPPGAEVFDMGDGRVVVRAQIPD